MLVYSILMLLTSNFVVSTFVFAIVQYILIVVLFTKLLKLVFPGISVYYNLLIFSFFSLFTLEFFFFSKDIFFIFFLLINSYHTGAVVITLLCLYLTMKYVRDGGGWRLLLIFLLGVLIVVSDKLFVVLFVAPVCLTCAVLFKKVGLKRSLSLLIINVAFLVAGTVVFEQVHRDTYNMLGNTSGIAAPDLMKQQFAAFFGHMNGYFMEYGVRSLSIFLFLLSIVAMFYVFLRSIKRAQNLLIPFYALFSIIFSVVVTCAPMLIGQYGGVDCLRYNIYPVYLMVLNLSVFLVYAKKSAVFAKVARPALLGLNLFLLVIGLYELKPAGLKGYFNYYPETAKLVDELAERENLKYGVANYWDAKKITMFSKKGVKVYAVFDDISFYLHVANNRWFLDNKFNFVVLNRFNDTTLYKTVLKDIEYLSYTPGLKLVRTRPFHYFKFSGSRVISE